MRFPKSSPADRTPASGTTASGGRWLERGVLAAIILACAIALSPNNVDPDLWGHVQYAEDALADGHLHATATHTYTAIDHRWINHENLSELALALGYRTLGPHGLLIAKTLLGLVVMLLMIRSAAVRGVPLVIVCAFLLLVATALTSFWAMRPQLASFLLLAFMVLLLDSAFADWPQQRSIGFRWLWATVPLFAVWANSHGAFVAGVCLFAAYLGIRSLELLRYEGRAAWPRVGYLAAIVAASTAATFANPYGSELHRWLLHSLRVPRPEISEWAAPQPGDAFFFPFVLLAVVSMAAWIGSKRQRDPAQGLLLLLCLWQAAGHSRHIALFAILAGFWVPVHLQSLFARLRARAHSQDPSGAPSATESAPLSPRARRCIGIALACVLVLLVARLSMRLYDFPVERNAYPVHALAYIHEQGLSGNLVVAFNWAQYALAALAPEMKVGFDGRFRTCYPQEVIDMHFDFLIGDVPGARYRSEQSGPLDPTRVLSYGRPDLVLVDRRFTHSERVMEEQQSAFVLLYQDSLAQVWGRQAIYDDPTSDQFVAESRRLISDTSQEGSVTWPALPGRRRFLPVVQGRSPLQGTTFDRQAARNTGYE